MKYCKDSMQLFVTKVSDEAPEAVKTALIKDDFILEFNGITVFILLIQYLKKPKIKNFSQALFNDKSTKGRQNFQFKILRMTEYCVKRINA